MSDRIENSKVSHSEQIRSIAGNLLGRWVAGEKLDIQEILAEHPELSPELELELRRLRLISSVAESPAEIASEASLRSTQLRGLERDSAAIRIRCPHCRNRVQVVDDQDFDSLQCDSCGSQFQLADENTSAAKVPRVLGQFELLERLGGGSFGTVYRAYDQDLDREVAIKVPRQSQLTPIEREQFLREARVAAQLSHPDIVRLYEIGLDGDTVYLVSELVEGRLLNHWFSDEQPTNTEIAALVARIASAAGYAHQRGVVHRDLKPSNIMMDREGSPRILDFGLAKRDAAEITLTTDGQILGTPAYMSPEQAAGRSHHVDGRADVYALGVMLFEMLTGELPFRGSVRMILQQVQEEDPPRLRKLVSNVPQDLEVICLKCLEKYPDNRYRTAHDLAADLARFVAGKPILARPVPAWERAVRWCKRKPTLATLGMLILLIGIAGPLFGWVQFQQRRRIESLVHEKLKLIDNTQQQTSDLASRLDRLTQAWRNRSPLDSLQERLVDLALQRYVPVAKARLQRSQDREQRLPTSLTLAMLYHAAGQLESASQYFEAVIQELESWEDLPNRDSLMVQCLLARGTIEHRLGHLLIAENAIRRADSLVASDPSTDRARVKQRLATVIARNSPSEAVQLSLEANQSAQRVIDRLSLDPEEMYRFACSITNNEAVLSAATDSTP